MLTTKEKNITWSSSVDTKKVLQNSTLFHNKNSQQPRNQKESPP